MTARTERHHTGQHTSPGAQARLITSSSVVTSLVVRAAGLVPARIDLAHVGTAEQQLGLTLGTVLVYLRAGLTARVIADGWSEAAVGVQVGPVIWEVCDSTAYTSMLRGWRQAAKLLGENPTENE